VTIQEVLVNRKPHKVKVLERNGNIFIVEVNGKTVNVKFKNMVQGKTAILEINDKTFQPSVERVQRNVLQVKIGGKLFEVDFKPKIPKESAAKLEPMATFAEKPAIVLVMEKDAVTAPIAGRIILLRANVGQKVERGECVCILEAMKMQNEITAPKAGVVKEFRVFKGAIVNKGDVLAVIA
jgi:biotin carboxyl carrier protein